MSIKRLDFTGVIGTLLRIRFHLGAKINQLITQWLEQNLDACGALFVEFLTTGLENFGCRQLERLGEALAGLLKFSQLLVMVPDRCIMLSLQAGEIGGQLALFRLQRLGLEPQSIALLNHRLGAGNRLAGLGERSGLAIRLAAQDVTFLFQLIDLRHGTGIGGSRLADQKDHQKHNRESEPGEQKKVCDIHGMGPNLIDRSEPSMPARTKAVACN